MTPARISSAGDAGSGPECAVSHRGHPWSTAREAADLLTNALPLPVRERAEIAHELLLSLDDGAAADAAKAWVAELEQRANEVRLGSVVTEDWETVKARLDERWRRL